jgi:hypothetical protein
VFNLLVGLFFSLSALSQPAFLKEGLVAFYSFDNSLVDTTSINKNLESVSALASPIFVNDRFGEPQKAVNNHQNGFDGLRVNNFQFSNNYTFSIWWQYKISPDIKIKGQRIAEHQWDNPTGVFSMAVISERLEVCFQKSFCTSSQINTNLDWHNTIIVVSTFTNSLTGLITYRPRVYLDGKSSFDVPVNTAISKPDLSPKSLYIGGRAWFGGIDDVRIYNRALSDGEVKALYDYESTPPDNSFITNGLVAYYPFDGNANDESGKNWNGLVGRTTIVSDRFGRTNAAYYSDEVGSGVDIPLKMVGIYSSSFSFWFKTTSGGVLLGSKGLGPHLKLVVGSENSTGPGTTGVVYFGLQGRGFDNISVIQQTKNKGSADGFWHHVVGVMKSEGGVFSSSMFSIFIDGKIVTGNSLSDINPIALPFEVSNLSIASDLTWSTALHTGPAISKISFDDVRIYNRALSDGEVKALYDYESTSPIQSPVLVSQPTSQTVNSGDNVVLSIGLQTDGTYNYQWQLNEQNIAGATTSSLAVNNAVAGVYRYRVIVSNSAGTVISDTATLTVSTPPAPSIVTQPTPKTVQEGANASFNVVATGQGVIVYQWQFNEQNLPGATSATLNLNGVKLNTAGRYRVLVSSQYGVTISDTVTLTVNANPPPTIVTQPISRTPAEGTQVSLTVTATGLGSLTYQWQINNQNIPGATSSTLVLSAVRPSVNGNYRVIVGNPYGTTISTEASVAVVVTDADSDGLSDYEELLLGTNANKADSDGDGLSDFAEVRTHGSNPLTTDTDGDGYSDGIEVARDGNPNNRSVTPTGALAVFPAVDVEFYTLNSVKYQLEVSTDMVSWSAQGGVVVGTGGSQNHLVRASKTTQFWRLKVVQ